MVALVKGRNVNTLFRSGMILLADEGIRAESRNGPVVVVPRPVVSVYSRPQERVLVSAKRDANPFFHLMESLWMLAGRNDAAFLNRHIKDFGDRFAEKDGTVHDAYGHRWREALGFDQLNVIVQRLKKDPNDRQAVLQMWDSRNEENGEYEDLKYIGENDLLGDWKTRPCNTHVYFRIQHKALSENSGRVSDLWTRPILDMTLCCRSNDMVFGGYGANAVHFSFLQEYLAGRIGVDIGTFYQLSNNFHGYLEQLDKLGDPSLLDSYDPYEEQDISAIPIGTNFDVWDEDLRKFMEWHNGGARNPHGLEKTFENEWFLTVAVPMARANSFRLDGDLQSAIAVLKDVAAPDWRRAGTEWMQRRIK